MGDSRDIEQNIEFDILNYVIVIDTLKRLINQYRILKGPNFQNIKICCKIYCLFIIMSANIRLTV